MLPKQALNKLYTKVRYQKILRWHSVKTNLPCLRVSNLETMFVYLGSSKNPPSTMDSCERNALHSLRSLRWLSMKPMPPTGPTGCSAHLADAQGSIFGVKSVDVVALEQCAELRCVCRKTSATVRAQNRRVCGGSDVEEQAIGFRGLEGI